MQSEISDIFKKRGVKMKKTKAISILLSALFMINVFSVSTFAMDKYSKEIGALHNIGISTDEIDYIRENENGLVFVTNYITGVESYVIYSENENGNINLLVVEGQNYNEIIFLKNGNISIDGIIMSNNTVMPYAYGSTGFVKFMPNSYPYTAFSDYGTVNAIDIFLSKSIKNMTQAAMEAEIALMIGIPLTYDDVLDDLVEAIKDTELDTNELTFTADVDRAKSIPAGLQEVYRYTTDTLIDGYNSHVGYTYYKIVDLL